MQLSIHHRLLHSSVFSEVFTYLPYFEQICLQRVSKHFYNRLVPRYLYQAHLSVHTIDTMFSYSTGEGNIETSLLWKYDVTEQRWKELKPSNGPVQFSNSMSCAVATDMNRVFFFGGSLNDDFSLLSDRLYEWYLPNDSVNIKQRMPIALLDAGTCYDRGFIYVVSGFIDVDQFIFNKFTYRYCIRNDTWQTLDMCQLDVGSRKVYLVKQGRYIYAFVNQYN